MKRLLLLVPVMSLCAAPVMAQTILSLGATGSAQGEPDEAVAHFQIQANRDDAASAQAAVNQAMAKALSQARAVPGVVATTGGYSNYSIMAEHQTRREFTAQQSLTLVQPAKNGVPDQAFSTLLGTLQSEGLMLEGLNGALSKSEMQTVQREALREALVNLRAEAEEIATTLHKKVGALQTLTVDNDTGSVVPRFPRMMAAAVSAPVPQSAPAQITVTSSVSAKIVLDPGA